MSLEKNRERVAARIRQSIRQSGVDVSAIAPDQEERLVNTVSDGMLLEFDSMLSELATKHAAPDVSASSTLASTSTVSSSPGLPAGTTAAGMALAESHGEEILWEGRPFLSLGELYRVTSDRIRMFTGLLARDVENIELIRLQDIDYHQGVSERIFGIGDIYLNSVDASHPVVTLRNVQNPEAVADIIRKAWMESRKRRGVVFRDIV